MNIQEKFDICTCDLREYAKAAGFSDVIIGLSGGIDSSVVAVMCVHVFGAEHVHGVLMPGPYSSESSVKDALALAHNLGIDTQIISINEPYEAFARVLAQPCAKSAHSVTNVQNTDVEQDAKNEQNAENKQDAKNEQSATKFTDTPTENTQVNRVAFTGTPAENTQARCRMVVLMALSNAHNYMLVNTGNKSEALMGYSTLYGDTAGAFAPIGCLYKTDVFEMARYMNSTEFERDVFCADGAHAREKDATCTDGAHAREKDAIHPDDVRDRDALCAGVQDAFCANSTSKRNNCSPPLIPENVLTKPPSAELSPGQEDEKCLGLPYVLLDKILIEHFEHGESVSEIAKHLKQDSDVAELINGTKGTKRTKRTKRETNSQLTSEHINGDTVQSIIATVKKFSFKRAMEPPYPQEKIY